MAGSDRHSGHVGSRGVLVAVYVVAFLAMGLVASVPFALAQATQHCPGETAQGAPPLPAGVEVFEQQDVNPGSITQGDATISWDGTVITITGGDVTFCVKSATVASGIVTRGPGTYSTAEFGLTNNQGQPQEVSHLVVYTVTTTPTSPPPTSPPPTSPPPTSPPPTSPPPTSPPPTSPPGSPTPPLGGGGGTSSPSVLGGGGTNTGSPSPLAFTGRGDIPWLIGAGMLLLLIGTLALRLVSKPAPARPTDESA
jgi:hypothetical protein